MSAPRTPHDALAVHRDEGPLAALLPAGRLPVPEVLLVAVATLVVAVPLVRVLAVLAGGGDAAALAASTGAWPAVGVAWALAMVGRLGRPVRRFAWPLPALLRAMEYGAVLVLVATVAGGAGYALLAALAFHHYDIVYRTRLRGSPPPRWVGVVTGGWSLRLPVLVGAAAADLVAPVAWTLAGLLAAVLLPVAVRTWLLPSRTRRPTA